jgi:hypothetical protein
MGEEIRGRAALREFYRQVFESAAPRLSDYTFECRFLADAVFVRESWRVTMTHLRQFASKDRCNSLILLAGAASGAEL